MYALPNPFAASRARRRIAGKQLQRDTRLRDAQTAVDAITPVGSIFDDRQQAPSATSVVARLRAGSLTSLQVTREMCGRALDAQRDTNCLTEIMIVDALKAAKELDAVPVAERGLLHGLPVSLKDLNDVKGYDSTMGYSSWCDRPAQNDAVVVQILRRLGAIPYVKTNVPQTTLTFECWNPLFGRTTLPGFRRLSPGGSTGGEAALIRAGGSLLGLGSDVGGSVRIPSGLSGICGLKPSNGRLPLLGNVDPAKGNESIPVVLGPMARYAEDCELLARAILSAKPWELDPNVIEMPWREYTLPKRLRIGYYVSDGHVPASPACQRTVHTAVEALKRAGHQVIPFTPIGVSEAMSLFMGMMSATSGAELTAPLDGDPLDPAMTMFMRVMNMPHWLRRFAAWMLETFFNDPIQARTLRVMNAKSVSESLGLVARRDCLREKWLKAWQATRDESGRTLDVILAPVNALPALQHDTFGEVSHGGSYTALFNMLDYTVGVVPVATVDKKLDASEAGVSWWGDGRRVIDAGEKRLRAAYDMEVIHGAPVGIQIVGGRLAEEKVLAVMQLLQGLLKA